MRRSKGHRMFVPLALVWVGCAPGAPPTAPASAHIAATEPASTSTPISPQPSVATTAPNPVPPPSDALPPPKSTTLPLARPGDSVVDRALAAGDHAFDDSDLTAAAAQYQAAARAAPGRAGPIAGLARVRIARVGLPMDFGAGKGNAEVATAVRDLRRAARMEPAFGAVQVELGRALLLSGDAEGALGTLRAGVALLPSEAEAHSALGVALIATGHRDEALSEFARAATLDAGSAARHGLLGTALLMNGRVADAVKEYEVEVRLDDSDARAHSDLGTALLASNEPARAVSELERAIALEPKRATFHSNLGFALQQQGQRAEAIAQYREALRLDDKLASAWINLAIALAPDPKTRAEARSALEKARTLDPSDPRVKANLEELDAMEHPGAAKAPP